MKYLFATLFLIIFFNSLAKAQTGSISGKVSTTNHEPLVGVAVELKQLNRKTATDANGYYSLKNIPYGKYALEIRSIEIKSKKVEAHISKEQNFLNIQAAPAGHKELNDVMINGKNEKRKMETSGFAVAVIDTKEASTRNLTTNELLNRAVGVRVRQNGGLGAPIEYNLNGMSGSTIGIFLDGIEVSTYGSSFNLNNIPPSMIERIEVYKGVLPSHLTGDYVGGAINVVLKKDVARNNATAAISYGSFNTYNADASLTLREKKTGLSFRGSGFYTYTDNSYEMWGKFAKYTDRNGILIRDFRAKRFNNTYKSIGGRFELGFTDTKWADQFFLGYNISDTYNEIPHGTTTAQPYVGRFTEFNANVFSLNYTKRNFIAKGLALNVNAVYSNRSTYLQDTVKTRYNWDGNPVILYTDYMIQAGESPKIIQSPTGAQQGIPTISQVDRKILNARTNLAYTLAPNHKISINHKIERTDRDDTNLLRPVNKDLIILTQLTKNIVSTNYEAQTFKGKLLTNIMLKYTANNTQQTNPNPSYKPDGSYQLNTQITNTFNDNIGYGATVSYSIHPKWVLIASMENSYIMPTEEQMYGNPAINILANPTLRPEQNINYNLGFRLGNLTNGKHKFSFYANAFWRNGYDKITRQTVDSVVTDSDLDIQATSFINLGRTQSRGVEAEIIYVFNNKLNTSLNFSKFNALYKRESDENGMSDERYNRQIPNEPFFTINANIQYRLNNFLQRQSSTNFYYNLGYVAAYDIAWYPSEGSLTPAQLSHDLGLSYRFPKNKLIASLDVKNVLNTALYDNFGVQKPGRGIYLKLNYTLGNF
ncbi:TonB-dependent receptor [Pedobacter sp. MW01-1-1]|uniref:TonB-dependent receptor n=1 Tax=Pedobacter sp. MW01-1-1 TaxID=3383027 RepID=UPI003FF121E4